MKIDIIVPTFNRASVLDRAIQSVLAQSYQDFNLIIVDDGSTDQTSSLLKKYQSHENIKIIHQENAGVSSARNAGVEQSFSPWISFLDSDDEWLPHKLKTQVEYLKAHHHCQFLHSEEIWIRNGVRVNPKLKHRKSGDDLFARSLEFCLISPSTVVLTRELFQKYGPFREDFKVCEDYDLWLKILSHETTGYISTPLINKYGGHPDQLSTTHPAMDYYRIKSLAQLLISEQDEIRKNLIRGQIQSKAQLLLKSYQKYGHEDAHAEITQLIKSLS